MPAVLVQAEQVARVTLIAQADWSHAIWQPAPIREATRYPLGRRALYRSRMLYRWLIPRRAPRAV